jgi:hypothetical protein
MANHIPTAGPLYMLKIDGHTEKMSVKEENIKWPINGFSRVKLMITATAQ